MKAVKKLWSVEERRAEIMRILESGGRETMSNFASYFGVSTRTIGYDIDFLSAFHPIETQRGSSGCVKLMAGSRKYQNILSEEQQQTLIEIFPLLDKRQSIVIFGLLRANGSKRNMERIEGLI